MPTSPARKCNHPGCPALITGAGSYCSRHQPVRQRYHQDKHYDLTKRDDSWKEYGGAQWKKTRAAYLAKHPVCECCKKNAAKLVHHLKPFRDNPDLRYEESNLRSYCFPCHNKTHKSKGGTELID